jgi:Holliday junction resolvase RusA-like endonuclease
MSVEINFPVEFIIQGVPLAYRARSREGWKLRVASAARAELQEGHWATTEPVAATIFYFPRASMQGDIDNIVEPILDALINVLYMNDRQVERILVQKFEPGRAFSFTDPTPRLAEVLERERPVLYVRVDNDVSRGIL